MKDTVEDMINRFLQRQELKAAKAKLESARSEGVGPGPASSSSPSGLAVIRADIALPETRQVRRAKERAARKARLGGYL